MLPSLYILTNKKLAPQGYNAHYLEHKKQLLLYTAPSIPRYPKPPRSPLTQATNVHIVQ